MEETKLMWKSPQTIVDTQKPIQLIENGFIPFELEYGVVMDQLSNIYKSWESCIREYIANAESACFSALKLNIPGYKPDINIIYNPSQCTLIINDNGIGLSKQMFMEVFRYFGRSRNGFDPTISGQFGLGAKSFVMLVGEQGSMILHTKSRETDECYKMYARKVGFDVLPNEDRDYGTEFTFVHDDKINKIKVVESIQRFSQFVRVPIHFTITGVPMMCNTDDHQHPIKIIEPSGPSIISMHDETKFLDDSIKDVIHQSWYRTKHNSFLKVSFDNEHYTFNGIIRITDGETQGHHHYNNMNILLISMLTEMWSAVTFEKAVVRVKTEDWILQTTPDRERFTDTSKSEFHKQLRSDIINYILTNPCEVESYRPNNPTPEFSTIIPMQINSYSDFLKLPSMLKITLMSLYNNGYEENMPEKLSSILSTLNTYVQSWDTVRGRGYRHGERLLALLERGTKIYLATEKDRKSTKMRARAEKVKKSTVCRILIDAVIPEELKQEYGMEPLSSVELDVKEEPKEKVKCHEVFIDPYSGYPSSSCSTYALSEVSTKKRNQAVMFKNGNLKEYLELLRKQTHTCDILLFKVTNKQTKWLKENTELLPIEEYIDWARNQVLDTSQGKMTVQEILNDDLPILHSTSTPVGERLMRAFVKKKDVIYVPLMNEDYFMVASIIHHDRLDLYIRTEIGQLDQTIRGSDVIYDRIGLMYYAKMVLTNEDDLKAIKSCLDSLKIKECIHIVDVFVERMIQFDNT